MAVDNAKITLETLLKELPTNLQNNLSTTFGMSVHDREFYSLANYVIEGVRTNAPWNIPYSRIWTIYAYRLWILKLRDDLKCLENIFIGGGIKHVW